MSSDLNFVEKQYQKRMSFWCVGLSSYLSSSSAQDEFYDFQRVSRGYFPNTLYKGIPVFSSSFCCDCQPLSEQWGNKKNRSREVRMHIHFLLWNLALRVRAYQRMFKLVLEKQRGIDL